MPTRIVSITYLILGAALLAPLIGARASGSTLLSCVADRALPNILVVVDGYSSGTLLPAAYREAAAELGRNPMVVHIHSQGSPGKYEGSWHPERFDADLPFTGLESAEKWIESIVSRTGGRLVAVVPGAEAGVLLADQLAFGLTAKHGIPSNGILLARRDKFLMTELIRSRGIRAARQLRSSKVSEIESWVREGDFFARTGAVVVKPLRSASSEGVHICRSMREVRDAARSLLGHRDEFGRLNDQVLVQEFLHGDEYVVNTVQAFDPATGLTKSVVTDVWRYRKRWSADGKRTIYWYDEMIAPNSEVARRLIAYNARVVQALGISTGWGHAEIIMTADGPVLVEIGARMMGAQQPRLVSRALGKSQAELGARSLLDPASLSREPDVLPFRGSAAVYTLKVRAPGAKLSPRAAAILEGIPGVVGIRLNFKAGQALPATIDLNTAMGDVSITGSPEQVASAILRLEELERTGRLEVVEGPAAR